MDSPIAATLRHIELLARHLEKNNLRGLTIVFLMELGMPNKCAGFELLIRAILLQYADHNRGLKNDIYAEVLEQCNQCSEDQIQQAIRDAIKAAWRRGSKRAWDWYFSYDGAPVTSRPANGDFIANLAYILELWLSHRREA